MFAQGIGVPRQLLYRVKQRLADTVPTLTDFMTLSPVPGFAKWLRKKVRHETMLGMGLL